MPRYFGESFRDRIDGNQADYRGNFGLGETGDNPQPAGRKEKKNDLP